MRWSRVLMPALAALTLVASCSSGPPRESDLAAGQGELDAEQRAEQFEHARAVGAAELAVDEELSARAQRAMSEPAELFEKATVIADDFKTSWAEQPCPSDGPVEEAFFDPPGDVAPDDLDIEPHELWLGYEIVRIADLVLPAGALLESGGEYMGDEGVPVPVGEPGTYPFFMALARYEGYEEPDPALAQLVLDPTSPPVRWEDDLRFGFVTDAGSGWIGSPESTLSPMFDADDEVGQEARRLVDESMFGAFLDEPICTTWARDDGTNFVLYANGFGDGDFPAAAGYDKDDRLVAITWFFGRVSWVLAGIPGAPPQPVQEQIDCRRAAVDHGAEPPVC